jgi:hypothetical protein
MNAIAVVEPDRRADQALARQRGIPARRTSLAE